LPPFGGNDLPALPANAIIKVPGEVVQSTTYTLANVQGRISYDEK
jgi:hypothetical protein